MPSPEGTSTSVPDPMDSMITWPSGSGSLTLNYVPDPVPDFDPGLYNHSMKFQKNQVYYQIE
jgi:hypothetical protein